MGQPYKNPHPKKKFKNTGLLTFATFAFIVLIFVFFLKHLKNSSSKGKSNSEAYGKSDNRSNSSVKSNSKGKNNMRNDVLICEDCHSTENVKNYLISYNISQDSRLNEVSMSLCFDCFSKLKREVEDWGYKFNFKVL